MSPNSFQELSARVIKTRVTFRAIRLVHPWGQAQSLPRASKGPLSPLEKNRPQATPKPLWSLSSLLEIP
jgi:hypothetical protein